jgi:hypothetical protein
MSIIRQRNQLIKYRVEWEPVRAMRAGWKSSLSLIPVEAD